MWHGDIQRLAVGAPRFPEYATGGEYNEQFDWHWRRKLKVGNTSYPQDMARAYEAMPASVYRHNEEIRVRKDVSPVYIGKQLVQVESMEYLMKPRRVTRRQALGSDAVKRRKAAVSSNFGQVCQFQSALEAKIEGTKQDIEKISVVPTPGSVEASSKQQISSQELLDSKYRQQQETQDANTRHRRVCFSDEVDDAEWIDVDDDEVGYFLKDGGGFVVSTVPDEYVIL